MNQRIKSAIYILKIDLEANVLHRYETKSMMNLEIKSEHSGKWKIEKL